MIRIPYIPIVIALSVQLGCAGTVQQKANVESPEDRASRILSSVLSESDPPMRGVQFNPKGVENVNNILSIKMPKLFKKEITTHVKDKYAIYSYRDDCGGQNPCLSVLYLIAFIPDRLYSFEQLVKKSIQTDFAENSYKVLEGWVDMDTSGADKKIILYGDGQLMGNSISGIYHDPKRKMNVQVKAFLSFYQPFSDDDWRRMLAHNLIIFSSIKFL
ncbi:hypothetical protein ACE5IS_16395 [Leptospira wolffii]|uniref:Lipoprotein n=1 Tax=Leptospira wolffii TaxID=409998 RepID=A0ABV5BSD1_9LEPT